MNAYKPGTVAVATVRGVPNVRVMRRELSDSPYEWQSARSIAAMFAHHDREVTDVRPLVVLDLDDPAKYVRALHATFPEASADWDDDDARNLKIADQIEAQTRPPKPAEPTGLGAVVEDAEGGHWVYLAKTRASTRCWRKYGVDRWAGYEDINAVRVLSEGVSNV